MHNDHQARSRLLIERAGIFNSCQPEPWTLGSRHHSECGREEDTDKNDERKFCIESMRSVPECEKVEVVYLMHKCIIQPRTNKTCNFLQMQNVEQMCCYTSRHRLLSRTDVLNAGQLGKDIHSKFSSRLVPCIETVTI